MGEHDGLFKRVFSIPEHAAAELGSVLPQPIAQALDLSALELVPGSFVDDTLAQRHTDLLFRAPTRSGQPVYLYVLLEHQSDDDPVMAFRVLEYMVKIWSALRDAEPHRKTLPPILTLVVYHGASPWRAPRRFHEMVEGLDEIAELSRFVPDLECYSSTT